jgi:flagellar assembly factor FliW
MILQTKHFDAVEINEEDVITFKNGIPGFEEKKKFVILYKVDDDNPFKWLQSVDDGTVAFVILDPRTFKDKYDIKIDDAVCSDLEIEDLNDVAVYSIVTIPEEIAKMTANLKAPLIINLKKNKGCQLILDDNSYSFRHSVLEELHQLASK